MTDTQQWRWTSKLPSLVFGLLLIVAGLLLSNGRWRWSAPIVGLVMVGVGLALVVHSTTVHAWCAPAGAMKFGAEFGAAFWHGPSFYDCIRLVYPKYGVHG